jgi:hypothetical protein
LHPKRIRITGRIIIDPTLLLIFLFIPHYCTGMHGALIFWEKILELYNYYLAKENNYVC